MNIGVNNFADMIIRARSQIPVHGLTGRALGDRSAAPGAGLWWKNLGIKCFPCVPIYE